MTIKYKSVKVTLNGALPLGHLDDVVNELIDDKDVLGIAFFEAENANDIDYDLRVADSNNTLQDFTTKYDYLSIIKGVNIKNVKFDDYYKPYETRGNGNRIKIGILLNQALAGGQKIVLKVVIKTRN